MILEKPLRVLHINTYDQHGGGAARAAYRTHMGLRGFGVDSYLLVHWRQEKSPFVWQPRRRPSSEMMREREINDKLLVRQISPSNPVFRSINYFPSDFVQWINDSDFDIVNLHWLGNMLSIEEIGQITKPVVWTMLDMWPFCGAEHYDDLRYPGRYRQAYTVDNRPPGYSGPDLDLWAWRRKAKAWAGMRFHLIGISHWLADCARESALMHDQPATVIPLGLDTNVYKPIEQRIAKSCLGLNPEKRYLLFGAIASISDDRKGFDLLQKALRQFASQSTAENTEILVFGSRQPDNPPDLGLPVHYLGTLQDDMSLVLLYSAADVMIAPSKQEGFGQTSSEAQACGCPVLTFAATGIQDTVDHEITGYLARPFEAEDMVAGLAWILENEERRLSLRRNARKRAEELWSFDVVSAQYVDVYKKILQG